MKTFIESLAILVYKKISGTATADDIKVINEWAAKSPGNKVWLQKVEDPRYIQGALETMRSVDVERIRKKMMRRISRSSLRRF